MLGLTLREEFQGRRLKGTAIELANENNTGATQIGAAEFLGITYPTADVVSAMEAIGPGHGQPVVLIGERGQGKSHLLAALYHGFNSPEVTAEWLKAWGIRLGQPKLGKPPAFHGLTACVGNLRFAPEVLDVTTRITAPVRRTRPRWDAHRAGRSGAARRVRSERHDARGLRAQQGHAPAAPRMVEDEVRAAGPSAA